MFVAGLVLFSGCSEDTFDGAEDIALCFSSNVAEITELKSSPLTSVTDFYAVGYNGTAQWFPNSGSGTPERVTLSGGIARYPAYGWESGSRTFYAYSNNLPAGATASFANDGVTLTYSGMPLDAANQTDVLLGSYIGNGDNAGMAKLTFYHPLAQVVVVNDGLELERVSRIDLVGVYTCGTAKLSGTGITWSNRSTPGTVSQAVTSSLSNGQMIGVPFMLIPQTFIGGSTIELRVSDGSKIFGATIDSKEFVAGKKIEIRIKYIKSALNCTVRLVDRTDDEPGVMPVSDVCLSGGAE